MNDTASTRRQTDQINQGTQTHAFLRSIELPFRLPTPIFGAMLAIWQLVPGLQRRFRLQDGRQIDFLRFLAWASSEGRHRYTILRQIPEWDEMLKSRMALPVLEGDTWEGTFSIAMFFHGVAKHYYYPYPILHSADARARVARSWWRIQRHRQHLPSPAHWQYEALTARFGDTQNFIDALRQNAEKTLTSEVFVEKIEAKDISLAAATTGPQISNTQDPAAWIEGAHYCGPRLVQKWASKLRFHFSKRPSEFQLAQISGLIETSRKTPEQTQHEFGVNLFGYAEGEIGIGEDVRMVARALATVGVKICVINVRPGATVSQKDRSLASLIVDRPIYSINLFCATGKEQIRFACEQGIDWFEGRYNIGLWPWELPTWPMSCKHSFALLDEIWGISQFTTNAFRKFQGKLLAMTLPVDLVGKGGETRESFGLPANTYLYVFSFDANSTISRKCPEGVVKAFQIAFPTTSDERVGLVIKVSHSNSDDKNWKKLLSIIRKDNRIFLVDETLRRSSVLALYDCCDCFVSLHRAEGFGRGIAEALLMKKQVICTGYSGNMDFCNSPRVKLVKFSTTSVRADEYFHGDGQTWASPDIDDAARLMKEVYLSQDVKELDFNPFDLTYTGRKYLSRLKEIQSELKLRKIQC